MMAYFYVSISLGHGVPSYLSQMFFWVFLCFGVSLILKLVDWVEQFALNDVNVPHPISCSIQACIE